MRIALTFLFFLAATGVLRAAGRSMTVDDLLAVKSVSDPQVSPDGKLVAYVVSTVDKAANRSNSDVWVVPADGGTPKQLTSAPGADNHPRWSPDGKTIAFVSTRGGSAQVWLLPVDGGEARQLTKLPIDASGPIWSPKGDQIAFTASVFPGQSPEETAKHDEEKAASKVQARTYDDLMIRHWDTWDEGKKSHLFVVDVASGASRDLTPDLPVNTPPAPFGGSTDYAWSPDGQTLAFTAEPLKDHPWSTNSDIWLVPAAGGEPRNLTEANLAADGQPAFSPDGKLLAYVRQERPGFEADQWVLTVVRLGDDAGEPIPLTKGLDRPVGSFSWNPEGSNLLATVDDGGQQTVYDIPALARRAPLPVLVKGGYSSAARARDSRLFFARQSAVAPFEIFRAEANGDKITALTHHNDELIKQLDLNPAESFTFVGADGDEVQGYLLKPPGFDPDKKVPVVFLIHGGPQGAWHDDFHARWNYQLFAAPGYAVVAINPRGSTGFGQKFTDQISRDWTGKVYEDLMKGLDHALATYDFLDGNRVAAAGGSYGGFMVNWIAGHSDRFKALISHAGVFDLHSKYFTTEELWFPEWEFGGTPWESPSLYQQQSPSNFVADFKTPTLVIHGALDFRVAEGQGFGMFTALRRKGVPARLVWFPDEGHWILKPQNRELWWHEVHGWLEKYLKP
jgi:dipeptidyl aminopeptidase/acylaminoacyl peptidase